MLSGYGIVKSFSKQKMLNMPGPILSRESYEASN